LKPSQENFFLIKNLVQAIRMEIVYAQNNGKKINYIKLTHLGKNWRVETWWKKK